MTRVLHKRTDTRRLPSSPSSLQTEASTQREAETVVQKTQITTPQTQLVATFKTKN